MTLLIILHFLFFFFKDDLATSATSGGRSSDASSVELTCNREPSHCCTTVASVDILLTGGF